MTKRLPPYGKQFQPVSSSGVQVAIGPGAWDFAKDHHYPIMVMPEGESASSFAWPDDGKPALIHERTACQQCRDFTAAWLHIQQVAQLLRRMK